jgi:hypothetical protein
MARNHRRAKHSKETDELKDERLKGVSGGTLAAPTPLPSPTLTSSATPRPGTEEATGAKVPAPKAGGIPPEG